MDHRLPHHFLYDFRFFRTELRGATHQRFTGLAAYGFGAFVRRSVCSDMARRTVGYDTNCWRSLVVERDLASKWIIESAMRHLQTYAVSGSQSSRDCRHEDAP